MAYSEVVKNFSRIREYMREFYVYGFKSRDEYNRMSSRSYDDERRRIESWLGDYIQFRQTPDGKKVFISIDSRTSRHNPLYKAWKAKSFTDGDITLHFILMDILESADDSLTISEIISEIDRYVSDFDKPKSFDESTVRKKLKEYESEGIVLSEKRGRTVCYRRTQYTEHINEDVLDFFSEVAPCGVIGSFLLDKQDSNDEMFAFKHHYITGALDSEIICSLFAAMHEKREITMETVDRRNDRSSENTAVPLQIMFSVQSGRQYLMAYSPRFKRIESCRVDNIISVRIGDVCERFDEFRDKFESMRPHLWGVSTQSRSGERMEHVEFTIRYNDDELFIPKRLEREKRCGVVEKIDDNTSRFSADVFDASELIPWIRTFICRITDISISDKKLEKQFKDDIEEMYALYGLKGGDES